MHSTGNLSSVSKSPTNKCQTNKKLSQAKYLLLQIYFVNSMDMSQDQMISLRLYYNAQHWTKDKKKEIEKVGRQYQGLDRNGLQ